MSADADTDGTVGGDTDGTVGGDADRTAAAAEFDRHRRRVLWALPTGLYLVGSRDGDEVNLMTANLVVQVCVEPKLVGVALERGSVTARLVTAGGGFTVSLLTRGDRDAVRRFVKPATEVERGPDGAVLAVSGQPVTEVGADRRPTLASAAGYLDLRLTSAEPLGSHTWFVGEVIEVGGEPTEVLRTEDTRMHYGG
jgi:flavin reductase (DIM6/NTAB) family NADH-FMN oxidoreductase RutF